MRWCAAASPSNPRARSPRHCAHRPAATAPPGRRRRRRARPARPRPARARVRLPLEPLRSARRGENGFLRRSPRPPASPRPTWPSESVSVTTTTSRADSAPRDHAKRHLVGPGLAIDLQLHGMGRALVHRRHAPTSNSKVSPSRCQMTAARRTVKNQVCCSKGLRGLKHDGRSTATAAPCSGSRTDS